MNCWNRVIVIFIFTFLYLIWLTIPASYWFMFSIVLTGFLLFDRNPTVQQDHLVKLLEQLLVHNRASVESLELPNSRIPTGADVPTLLGTGRFSLFDCKHEGLVL